MVEIKAFVRVNAVDKVIRALEAAGITNLTVIDVRAIWQGLKHDLHYSVELTERYMNVAKIGFAQMGKLTFNQECCLFPAALDAFERLCQARQR